jgi:hypothetical protein
MADGRHESGILPLQGFAPFRCFSPRALPWAKICRSFGAGFAPPVTRYRGFASGWQIADGRHESGISPLQGFAPFRCFSPRASPWAEICRSFGAGFAPPVTRYRGFASGWQIADGRHESGISPLQGFAPFRCFSPRASPWAKICRSFGAGFAPLVTRDVGLTDT